MSTCMATANSAHKAGWEHGHDVNNALPATKLVGGLECSDLLSCDLYTTLSIIQAFMAAANSNPNIDTKIVFASGSYAEIVSSSSIHSASVCTESR